ncbi:putative metalloprotease CJM1_0395 family protein [Thiocystis violacea]|uniref:putative metalloprotease CJM1_0395 family protein n=1 Tax=Thiocystis violacea TaxID=13725 RepID=UPI001F5BF290|nr:putative metalloprotease CJM1_0395 family protein [Thiocystis violacea]
MEIHSSAGFSSVRPFAQAGEPRQAAPAVADAGVAAESDPSAPDTADEEARKVGAAPQAASAEQSLSDEELREVQLLKQRDAEVRAHEQAHMAAGGQYVTGGPSYSYQRGPDGNSYAIGGEVGIDTSAISGDPAAAIAKARTIIRAALAPAEPSGQDQRVAAAARSMEIDAQRQLTELQDARREAVVAGAASPGAADEASAQGAAEDASASPSSTSASNSAGIGAQARLKERIANLFAAPVETVVSQYA